MFTSTETTKNEERLQESTSLEATSETLATGPGTDFHDAEDLASGFINAAIATQTLDLLPEAPRTLVDAPSICSSLPRASPVHAWSKSSILTRC
jgi:hypothetical protein